MSLQAPEILQKDAVVACAQCKSEFTSEQSRVVVVSCGHLFCTECLHQSQPMKCPSCDHPLFYPCSVCVPLTKLVHLNQYGYFPETDCVAVTIEAKDGLSSKAPRLPNMNSHSLVFDSETFVHFGVMCDGCGVYPIVGHRFQCQDCTDVGFDLCSRCMHDSKVDLRGRFNQNHSGEHNFREVPQDPLLMQAYLLHRLQSDLATRYLLLF